MIRADLFALVLVLALFLMVALTLPGMLRFVS